MNDELQARGHEYRARVVAPRPEGASHLTQRCYAFVLAGGRGTRLQQLTDWRAKPAVPFAGKLKIIDFALSNCVNSGIRRIAVLTQYKAQSRIRHVERGWGFLAASLGEYIDVAPAQQCVDDKWYAGTADAVYQNLNVLRDAGAEHVLILAGDHVYKMDYSVMLAEHVTKGADVTVACVEVPLAKAVNFGVMAVDDDGRVVAFDEKPARPRPLPGAADRALASMGIYVFDTAFLCARLERDDDQWPILSLQVQLPPAKFVFDADSRRGTALDSLVSGGCIVSGATVRRSILFAKVRVADQSLIEDSVVLPDVVIGKNVVLRRTVVDKRCVLPDGFKAGAYPAEDKARFHVTGRGIRLIEIAERYGCEAIIIGARGRGALHSALLGSVSQAALHASKVPVTIVKHAETDAAN